MIRNKITDFEVLDVRIATGVTGVRRNEFDVVTFFLPSTTEQLTILDVGVEMSGGE